MPNATCDSKSMMPDLCRFYMEFSPKQEPFPPLDVVVLVTGSFSCTMKFLVKDCDPATQEPDDDGYDDEYVVH